MAITVTAGQRITAANLNAFVPIFVQKTSDESRTSTTTNSNDATFAAIAFDANTIWECLLVLDVDGATAGDLKTTWTVTGGTTFTSRVHVVGMGVTGTAANDSLNTSVQARTSAASVSMGIQPEASGVRTTIQERFFVTSTTAGTITLQWAQVASNATASTIRAGSYFIAHRVS